MADNIKKTGVQSPPLNHSAYKQVSDFRKEQLRGDVDAGRFNAGPGASLIKDTTSLSNGSSLVRKASASASITYENSNSLWRGPNNSQHQMQPIYSPLWIDSNLNLPRDRATINAWCRAFFALNGIVQNAIGLHATYPISKLNITCPDKKVENFFNEMIEETELLNICSYMAQEYWLLGETFVYADLDERRLKWSRFTVMNPDFMVIKPTIIPSEPVIMMKPDENLRKIVFSNKPSDLQQKKQLSPQIIEHVRRGENIPLDNFYTSHLSRKISPYEIRGTGLPVGAFRSLMLFDLLRECIDEETEILTEDGWKSWNNLIDIVSDTGMKIQKNDGYSILIPSAPKAIKIACFNSETNQLEYHYANSSILKEYNGEMVHFKKSNVDIKVTPDHDMWINNNKKGFKKEKAKDLINRTKKSLQTVIPNNIKDNITHVNVCGTNVDIDLYLKILGYMISEGSVEEYSYRPGYITITQTIKSTHCKEIQCAFEKFANLLNVKLTNCNFKNDRNNATWRGVIYNAKVHEHFKNEICGETNRSWHKKVPRWIFKLSKEKINILLNAMIQGDGSVVINKHGTSFKYHTSSLELANNVHELSYLCEYASYVNKYIRKNKIEHHKDMYRVSWSTGFSKNPSLMANYKKSKSQKENVHKEIEYIHKEKYLGKVWCVEVPTGLFIARRNGRIVVQGNCKYVQAHSLVNPITLVKLGQGADYRASPSDIETWRNIFADAESDKNFKIFAHDAISVERIGASGAVMDVSNDVQQLLKEIYASLMVPQVIIEGGGDITYQNGGVSLDVLRQRYMNFRNKLSLWLKRKVFAPISKLNEFYVYKDSKKELIIPEVEWNHMSLFDTNDYIQTIGGAVEKKVVSKQTYYRSLGLDYEDEKRKLRQENVDDAILKKEEEALKSMNLNELRTITDDSEIQEPEEAPVPGETTETPGESAPSSDSSTPPESSGGGEMPKLNL